MCLGGYNVKIDPAIALAAIITVADVGHDKHLRKVIREQWGRICVLAHAIYDEETSAEVAITHAAKAMGRDPDSISSFMECVAAAGYEVRQKEKK